MTRTGCCGCPISYKAVDDLEKIRPYEPNVVKAAWNIFGESYEYRRKYNQYKEMRRKEEKKKSIKQMSIFDFLQEGDTMIEFLAGVVVGAVAVILWALRAAKRRNEDET